MRREHAVVEHEVDPWAGGERGQLFEQRERLEHELARAVRPRSFEREHDAAIGQVPQPILGHRRAEQIAAELFQARAIRGRHCDVGVEVEAREMRVPGGGREQPRGVGLAPDAPHAGARAGPSAMRPESRRC
jgi:hypothetical protein